MGPPRPPPGGFAPRATAAGLVLPRQAPRPRREVPHAASSPLLYGACQRTLPSWAHSVLIWFRLTSQEREP
jgi:hypothetical protein